MRRAACAFAALSATSRSFFRFFFIVGRENTRTPRPPKLLLPSSTFHCVPAVPGTGCRGMGRLFIEV